MEHEFKNLDELEKIVDRTKGDIMKCRKELDRLESYLTWLNTEKIKLCNDELIQDNKLRDEAERKHKAYASNKRHLPIAPIYRQLSESESIPPNRRSMMTLPRSSTSSFVHKSETPDSPTSRNVSCSMENLTLINPKSVERGSVKGSKKFSTIDFGFLKKLTNYGKSPKKDGSASISSLDDVLSESYNSLTTSADDLDAEYYAMTKSSRSEEVHIVTHYILLKG